MKEKKLEKRKLVFRDSRMNEGEDELSGNVDISNYRTSGCWLNERSRK